MSTNIINIFLCCHIGPVCVCSNLVLNSMSVFVKFGRISSCWGYPKTSQIFSLSARCLCSALHVQICVSPLSLFSSIIQAVEGSRISPSSSSFSSNTTDSHRALINDALVDSNSPVSLITAGYRRIPQDTAGYRRIPQNTQDP